MCELLDRAPMDPKVLECSLPGKSIPLDFNSDVVSLEDVCGPFEPFSEYEDESSRPGDRPSSETYTASPPQGSREPVVHLHQACVAPTKDSSRSNQLHHAYSKVGELLPGTYSNAALRSHSRSKVMKPHIQSLPSPIGSIGKIELRTF